MKMMTREEIQTEFGWCEDMIRSLLRFSDSIKTRRRQQAYEQYELYSRDRVLAASQTPEGRITQRQWDETLRGNTPSPCWTTRLGDIGRALGITAVAAGRILELLGYRVAKRVTDSAVAAGCGVRRWDGYVMHDDWHPKRAVDAIRSAAEVPGNTAVADALAAAIAKQHRRERVAGRKRTQEETHAAHRHEEEAVVSGLQIELRAFQGTDPSMSLLDAVEYITPDCDRRIALYGRRSTEDQSISPMGQDDPGCVAIASSVDKDLALLGRRAKAEGFSGLEECEFPRPETLDTEKCSVERYVRRLGSAA